MAKQQKNAVLATRKQSRYADALESSPELLDELKSAAEESLSLRDEISVARTILGESIRSMGRATAQNNGVLPQAFGMLVLQQMREVNSLISSCASIEAKRQDQQLDAAKLILLLGRLRDDLRLSLKEAGFLGAIPFIDAAFGRARWTGQLDDAAVAEALQAPASFDVKFRPIERDSDGKLLEGRTSYDTPEDALGAGAKDLDLTSRSTRAAQNRDAKSPLRKVEDRRLEAELSQANEALDAEIADAAESGAPLPGVSEERASKLNKLDHLT